MELFNLENNTRFRPYCICEAIEKAMGGVIISESRACIIHASHLSTMTTMLVFRHALHHNVKAAKLFCAVDVIACPRVASLKNK
jgi:hypothetical protein